MAGGYGSNGNQGTNLDGFAYGESNVFIQKPDKDEEVLIDSQGFRITVLEREDVADKDSEV
jgi:hypothetical protein